MAKTSINIEIAGRTYPLNVEETEKEKVFQAADEINKAVKYLKENYAVSDMRDLLAMASLQLLTKKKSNTSENKSQSEDYSNVLKDLKELSEILDK